MAEGDGIKGLLAIRAFLKSSLESSRAISSALSDSGQRLDGIKERFLSLEAAAKSTPPSTFCAIRDNIVHALGPAAAVLKVHDSIRELEKSLMFLAPCSDLSRYLTLAKQHEEAMRFLTNNCGLAIQWLEDILQFLEASQVGNELYFTYIMKSLRILRELQATEERSCLNGGLLYAAYGKLEAEFRRLLVENSRHVPLSLFSSPTANHTTIASSPLPQAVIKKLQAIIGRLNASNSLDKCLSIYVEIRSLNAGRSLRALDLEYLEKEIKESDDVQDIEDDIDQWCRHFELAVKVVFEVEYELCNDVFDQERSEVRNDCFARIATHTGILSFLRFGKKVAQCKKGPIKLLKLLDIFRCLDNQRADFNKLFRAEASAEIQTETRDLIKRVVNGACEIFWELPVQVKLQRSSSPPPDGSVPKLVTFVTSYCNHLLGDNYRPLLTQVLVIQQNWKQEKYQEELLTNQIICIVREIGLNLDAWTKAHLDISLSYIFMMNNHGHFCKLKGTELGDLMGKTWLNGHEQYKDYYMALYLRECWGRILALLRQETRIPASPTRAFSGDLVKKRLKAFNEAFDAIYEKQSNWVVPDEDLRLKMCKLVVQALVPAYRSYLQTPGLKAGENDSPSKYVKYTPHGLETMLSSLFEPKLRKFGSAKQTHFIGKIKDIVTEHFRLPLMAV